ncbi:MAG: fimbrillin family protein [Bacteroidaceae bacterium]|nr:fimbrillin family protein [Bacteroidaceae bacterium]
MKKSFWMLGMAVAALASCTESEVVEIPEGRVIGFEPFVDKMTRAVQNITTVNQITYFNVFGYHADFTTAGDGTITPGDFEEEFINAWVAYTQGTGGNYYWKSENAGYWEANKLFRFAAYTNGSNAEELTAAYDAAEDKLTITAYEVTDASVSDPSEKPDLLAAISGDRITTSVTGNTDVIFNFRHMLAKVTLVLYNNSANMDLHYHNLSVADVSKKGNCNMAYNSGNISTTWDNLAESGAFSYGSEIVVPHPTEGSATHTTHEVDFYMIPQSSNKTLTFETHQVDANGNVAYDKTYSANMSVSSVAGTGNNNWEAGHHYRYIINLGETGHTISFNVSSIQGWVTDINGSGTTDNTDYIALSLTETASN